MGVDVEPCNAYVGCEDGLHSIQVSSDGIRAIGSCVGGNVVRDLAIDASHPETVYVACGYRGWGLHRSFDGGRSAQPIAFLDRWVWGVALHPLDPHTLFVGTEPPAVHISHDDGESFVACSDIDRLASRSEWTFFYDPFHSGHVHGFALHRDRPHRVLAGVEVGAFVASDDDGKTWREALVGHDVHRVVVDPDHPDRLLAATGEGMFASHDQGNTWEIVAELRDAYMHQIAFDPSRWERAFACVDAEGFAPLWRSEDAGHTWSPLDVSLPQPGAGVPLTFHPQTSGVLFFGGNIDDDRGALFVSEDAGENWRQLEGYLPKIWRVEMVPIGDRRTRDVT
jgi:hypothetical protein